MLPFTQPQAIVAITRPPVVLTIVISLNALLFPLGQGSVVGEVVLIFVNIRASAHSSEHLINLGLRRSTSAYRVLWMLLDAARHGGVARPTVHRGRLRQNYGTVRRIGVARRPTGVDVMRPTSRATRREDPQNQGPEDEEAGSQVFHAHQTRAEGFSDAMTDEDSEGCTFVRAIG